LTRLVDESIKSMQFEVDHNFASTGRRTKLLVVYQARCRRCVQTDWNTWLFCAKSRHSSAAQCSSKVRQNFVATAEFSKHEVINLLI